MKKNFDLWCLIIFFFVEFFEDCVDGRNDFEELGIVLGNNCKEGFGAVVIKKPLTFVKRKLKWGVKDGHEALQAVNKWKYLIFFEEE